MTILKNTTAILTVAIVVSAFTTAQTVSGKEQKETITTQTTEVKTSTTPNKLLANRRGYYDRYNDTWVYFKK